MYEEHRLAKTLADQEGVQASYVQPYADPALLCTSAVLAFCTKDNRCRARSWL